MVWRAFGTNSCPHSSYPEKRGLSFDFALVIPVFPCDPHVPSFYLTQVRFSGPLFAAYNNAAVHALRIQH